MQHGKNLHHKNIAFTTHRLNIVKEYYQLEKRI